MSRLILYFLVGAFFVSVAWGAPPRASTLSRKQLSSQSKQRMLSKQPGNKALRSSLKHTQRQIISTQKRYHKQLSKSIKNVRK